MKTATRLGVKPAARPVTLDDRLTLRSLAMDDRLAGAHGDMAIRTARIDTEATEILAAPLSGTAPAKASTTVKEVFAEAARLIAAHGLIRGYVGNAQTGYCLIGAIRKAAGGNRRLEDAAEEGILQRIRREYPDMISAGAWSDSQHGPAPVLRMLS